MLNFLPATLKGCLLVSLYFLNTLWCFCCILPLALIKLAVPWGPWRVFWSAVLKWLAERWVGINSLSTRLVNRVTWDVEGLSTLENDRWYLVVSNHQSWTDILVLQTVFHGRIPFLKFFLKKELFWVPLLGLAWWALDFPFMKRYSQSFLQKNPHLAGKDLETTRRACRKFKKMPVSVMNFVEGTRFTPQKHRRQESPHANLLKPKAGGVAFVLGAMGERLDALVNVTIAYPHGKKSFWDFMCGRVDLIRVRIAKIPVTDALTGDYFGDEAFRDRFQIWLNDLWTEKDRELTDLSRGD